MKSLNDMMRQAQELQGKMNEMQDKLGSLEVEGTAGGGMVTVVLNGKGEMQRVNFDPDLIKEEEKDVLEDLVVAAHNDARAKLEARMSEEMSKIAGDLPLPPGFKFPI